MRFRHKHAAIGAYTVTYQEEEVTMAEDDNPLEGKEFADALAKLESSSPEAATLISMLRDAVTELQEQLYSGDDDEDDDD